MSLLASEFDVRSVLHGQVSLAAVNEMYVIHEAMNGCKKSKDSLKACFENVNTVLCTSYCLWWFCVGICFVMHLFMAFLELFAIILARTRRIHDEEERAGKL